MALSFSHPMVALMILAFTCSLVMFHSSPSSINTDVTPNDRAAAESKGFCQGMFMAMSMSGFQWSFFRAREDPGDCLNYLAPSWKLDDRGKFQGAVVYSMLLGMLTEGTYVLQVLLQPYIPKRLSHLAHSLLYGIQRFMGYVLMLVTMMYSWELFFSVIFGISLGRLVFPDVTRRQRRADTRRTQYSAPVSPTNSHPTLATTSLDDRQHTQEVVGGENESLLTSDAMAVRRRR